MSWNSIYLRRKYIQWTKDGPKSLWIGPCIGWPVPHIKQTILSTLVSFWWNWTSRRYSKIHSSWRWIVQFNHWPIYVEKMGCRYRDLFRDSSSVLRYFLQVIFKVKYVSLLHYGFVTLHRNYSPLIPKHVCRPNQNDKLCSI